MKKTILISVMLILCISMIATARQVYSSPATLKSVNLNWTASKYYASAPNDYSTGHYQTQHGAGRMWQEKMPQQKTSRVKAFTNATGAIWGPRKGFEHTPSVVSRSKTTSSAEIATRLFHGDACTTDATYVHFTSNKLTCSYVLEDRMKNLWSCADGSTLKCMGIDCPLRSCSIRYKV